MTTRFRLLFMLTLLAVEVSFGNAMADSVRERDLAQRINGNTVAVVSGTPGGTYFRMAADLAFVLDDGENLRILPILGKGAGQNAYDVRFLKGVDLGFVRTDTLEQLKQDNRVVGADRTIVYVARLFNDELHVLVGPDVTDVHQLEGKKVSFDVKGSGSDYTGRSMFEGIGVKVQPINVDQPAALEMLKAGEISAVVSVAAKTVAFLSAFDGGGRYHFLDVPYADNMADRYFPATLQSTDYPKLIPEGRSVKTMAVGTILAAYNWPENTDRHRRIARFIDAFFSKFDQFLTPSRHPKWREVNLNATVAGWRRSRAAQAWLDRNATPITTALTPGGEPTFARFLNETKPKGDLERDELFNQYIKWRRSQ